MYAPKLSLAQVIVERLKNYGAQSEFGTEEENQHAWDFQFLLQG